jgi:hypothetical protein
LAALWLYWVLPLLLQLLATMGRPLSRLQQHLLHHRRLQRPHPQLMLQRHLRRVLLLPRAMAPLPRLPNDKLLGVSGVQ